MSALTSKTALRRAACLSPGFTQASQSRINASQTIYRRYASSHGDQTLQGRRRWGAGRIFGGIAVGGAMVGAAVYLYPILFGQPVVDSIPQAEIEFEKKRKRSRNKENNRDLLSSQHIQVKKSWENPGVYAWGNNAGRAVAPDSKETTIKTPRRIDWFDGMLLRDLKIDSAFGVAVTEQGDLVQWGTGYSPENPSPAYTLKGKDLIKLAISRDRILALSKSGSVYSLPVSKTDQLGGAKPSESSSSLSIWSSPGSNIHYRQIQPSSLGWGEKVVDIQSGLEHALLLTSSGRVFSAASSTESYPSRGQLGISGLTWATRPQGPVDQPHEIATLKGFKARKIATGDFHSLVLDDEGRIFAFGDNSVGQLGFPAVADASIIDNPSILPLNNLYRGTDMVPKVTSIAAGGCNSFFTVDATRLPSASSPSASSEVIAPARTLGKVVADTWALGEGIHGCLGTGRWTHISDKPSKIKALSGLYEWDETNNRVIPIRLSRLSVGATHTAAVLDNVTYVDASGSTGENDTNWGADVMWWGGNEYYQLGNGKRTNANAPLYIAPLDGGAEDAKAGRKGEEHRFQITPRQTVRLGEGGKGRKVSFEQRVECGRYVTAVYSGA